MIFLKRTVLLLLIICFLFGGCKIKEADISDFPTVPATEPVEIKDELRGIWISCYDIESAAGKTREEYSAITDEMFRNIGEFGLNTAFVHLRAYSDAFYKSDIFPYSKYIAGKRGAQLDFDPFEVMLESAEKYKISVHAWINPFRISYKNDITELCENEPAYEFIKSKSTAVGILNSGIYYNPANTDAQKLILDGIREIINKYPVDGIHIDDYFYPEDCDTLDEKEYSDYISSGGKLAKDDWRRAAIDSFVSSMYAAVKSVSDSLTVSISPGARTDVNFNTLYADCEKWLNTDGYADCIIPQLYFGFEREEFNFGSLLAEWNSYPRKTDIVCGLAAYKCGTDESDEWLADYNVLAKQLEAVRAVKWNGFVIFSYSDLLRPEASGALNILKESIKNEKK